MNYARLNEASVVVEVFRSVDDGEGNPLTPAMVFRKELASEFIAAPDEVYVGWTKSGEEWTAPAPPAPPPAPTPPPAPVPNPSDEALFVAGMFEAMIDKHINDTAKSLRYESIHTAVSYAEEPAVPKFQAEGRALREWRSLVYAAAIQVQLAVMAGTEPMPASPAALIALLPTFVPPEV